MHKTVFTVSDKARYVAISGVFVYIWVHYLGHFWFYFERRGYSASCQPKLMTESRVILLFLFLPSVLEGCIIHPGVCYCNRCVYFAVEPAVPDFFFSTPHVKLFNFDPPDRGGGVSDAVLSPKRHTKFQINQTQGTVESCPPP